MQFGSQIITTLPVETQSTREREVINIVDTHELGNITRSQRFSGGNANADCGPARW